MSTLKRSHEHTHTSEHGNCCGHMQWWRANSQTAERKPFALPGTKKRYAPDMTVRVHHVRLEVAVDPVGKTLAGTCASTIEPIGAPVSKVAFASTDLEIQSVKSG